MPRRRGSLLAVAFACAAIAWLLAVGGAFTVRAGEDEGPAVTAARKRQATVETLTVEFRVTEIMFQGGLSESLKGQGGMHGSQSVVPTVELHLESTNRMVIAKDKVRTENNHPMWVDFRAPDGKPLIKPSVMVFDGSVKAFHPAGARAEEDFPAAEIWTAWHGPTQLEILPNMLAPILAMFRGLSPAVSPWPIASIKATGTTRCLGGATCREYFIDDSVALRRTFWLDADHDCLIRRVQAWRRDWLTGQLDIRYRQDPVQGWVPASWVDTQYATTGRVWHTTKVKVLKMQFNEPQPAWQFDLQFPPGTKVYNEDDRKTYLVQPDGSLSEYHVPAIDESAVPETEPDVAWYRKKSLLIGAAIALATVFALVYCLKRRKGKVPPPRSSGFLSRS